MIRSDFYNVWQAHWGSNPGLTRPVLWGKRVLLLVLSGLRQRILIFLGHDASTFKILFTSAQILILIVVYQDRAKRHHFSEPPVTEFHNHDKMPADDFIY